ncbi:GDSL esterase/lipase At1g71691 [Ricinus communis]|uniref:GDSL esterase/lipase At1g71691 n=1 Tax=Ricinus communis TaxID=3988 RepID=UPI00077217EB|nr:GDSL esterase/lipase At1g71691 [Ricinus communis]|eukprot:XP_015579186.1 GDSL esterase/lipase At1g71691 isoform X1 [Ricinus communis]
MAALMKFSWLVVSLVMVLIMEVGLGQNVDPFGPVGGFRRREMVPAMFIFGDSLIDNGNNNNLPSFAKANYFPYGIDFNGGPTGRFSNGYTMVDQIAEMLGLPLIPAYSEASGDDVLHGVNYASAAAGILDITGRNFVGRIPFNQQIRNFQNTLDQITDNLGAVDVARAIGKSMFFVGMGSNDYLNNYLMPNYPTKNQYNGPQYANLLVQQYTQQLNTLYNLGARKFILAGLGVMGCIPSILAQSPAGLCSEEVNQLVMPFNENVKTMMNNFNNNLPGAKFIFLDVARMFRDILTNAPAYGFSVINRGCCGIGRNRGQVTCLPFQTPCPNREQYIFWDAFHPTEAVNILMGKRAFNGDTSIVYPMNIEQLANLDLETN